MPWLSSIFKRPPTEPRLAIRGEVIAAVLRDHFGARLKRPLVISAPNYLTLTRDEAFKLASRAWLPWENGNCERQTLALVVEAARWAQKQGLRELPALGMLWGRHILGAELHSYAFGIDRGSAPGRTYDLFLQDQTTGTFLLPSEMVGDVWPVLV